MEMCYNGVLVMPRNYAVVNDNEMEYVQGGGSATVSGTAGQIRTRLTAVIGASLVGTGATAGLGAVLGGAGGAIVGAVLGGGWFVSYLNCASSAHSKVEKIISKYGKNKKCKMTTTYSFAFYCTSITVKAV